MNVVKVGTYQGKKVVSKGKKVFIKWLGCGNKLLLIPVAFMPVGLLVDVLLDAAVFTGIAIIFNMFWLYVALVVIGNRVYINSQTVKSHEVITEDITKDAASGVARGIVGGALLGPVGLLAGAMSAKNNNVRHVAIEWLDGQTSLLEVDNTTYHSIITNCFK